MEEKRWGEIDDLLLTEEFVEAANLNSRSIKKLNADEEEEEEEEEEEDNIFSLQPVPHDWCNKEGRKCFI